MTVFLSILNQMEFQLVQNRKKNCHHDHISFNGNRVCFLSVQKQTFESVQTEKSLLTECKNFSQRKKTDLKEMKTEGNGNIVFSATKTVYTFNVIFPFSKEIVFPAYKNRPKLAVVKIKYFGY